MIFTGDISIPFVGGIKIDRIPIEELNKRWIGNLEGSLVDADADELTNLLKKRIVFNSVSAIRELLVKIPYHAFGIANNHLLDACGIKESLSNLESIGIQWFGAGHSIEEAARPLLLSDDGIEYAIYAFGSRNINCVDARANREGSNPYNKWHVSDLLSKAVKMHPNRRVIAFMHWNTELELFPQPLDRELCHQLIDMGVYAIIGCHAHRVQPFEIYKGHPIVYGLGNFAFRQNTYMSGKLQFPDFSYTEIAFEIDNNRFYVHQFEYNPSNHTVTYIGKKRVSLSQAPFATLDNEQYKKWFKNNRYQRKGITISYFEDSRLKNELKYQYGVLRGAVINLLVKNNKVFHTVKSIASKIFK